MTEAERSELVAFVATNPDAGAIIPETGGVRKLRWAIQWEGQPDEGRAECDEEADSGIGPDARKEDKVKRTASKTRQTGRTKSPTPGERILRGLDQAIAWARGEDVSVRVTTVEVPIIDVRTVRRKLKLSQAQFAAKFGFPPATLRNWEQGRTRPDTPTRVLLAVIAKHPEVVEDVLRKAS